MDTNLEAGGASRVHGSLLRLDDGREFALYERDGAVMAANLSDGADRLYTAGEWFDAHGRRIAHAQRRGEVEIVSPIPAATAQRIERLHRAAAKSAAKPAVLLARLAAGFRRRFAANPA